MRKSLQDIANMVKAIPYAGQLPEEIAHLHCYIADTGHCILSVPRGFAVQIPPSKSLDYEVPLPVRYVLEKGWEAIGGTDSISVDVPYDSIFGALVPDDYEEF